MTVIAPEVAPPDDTVNQYFYGQALAEAWRVNTEGEAIDIEWPTGWEYSQLVAKRDEYQQELITRGKSPKRSARIAHRTYADSIDPVLKRARQELRTHGESQIADKYDTELGDWLVQHTEGFQEVAELRVIELEEIKERFIEKMEWAIDYQGLPLTREQLHSRLEHIELGFFDPFGQHPSLLGQYSANKGVASVSIDLSGPALEAVMYHELIHAIGGNRYLADPDHEDGMRVRKVALELPGRPTIADDSGEGVRPAVNERLWMNEAVTDLIANILTDNKRQEYQFGDLQRPLADAGIHLFGVLKRLPDDDKLIYADYKKAALAALRSIPVGTLMRAYFAADYDQFEADQYAGRHAERDLQRAIKIAGGRQRIQRLRLLDQLFQEGENEMAVTQARLIHQEDVLTSDVSRAAHRQAVIAHTERYQAQIGRARAHHANQEQAA